MNTILLECHTLRGALEAPVLERSVPPPCTAGYRMRSTVVGSTRRPRFRWSRLSRRETRPGSTSRRLSNASTLLTRRPQTRNPTNGQTYSRRSYRYIYHHRLHEGGFSIAKEADGALRSVTTEQRTVPRKVEVFVDDELGARDPSREGLCIDERRSYRRTHEACGPRLRCNPSA